MSYIVTRAFKDSMDNDRLYRVGDVYPAGGGKVNKKRVEELLMGTNRNGKVYIREETEPADDNVDPDDPGDNGGDNVDPDEEQ